MTKLVVTVEDQLLSEWPLDEQEILIGRGADCNIVVRDPLVSRHHAKISKNYGGYFVEDLDSTNGISVNGRRVRKQLLKYGDRLQIGTHELCLTDESVSDTEDNEKTVFGSAAALTSNRPSTTSTTTLATPEPAVSGSGKAYVKYNTGADAGKSETIERSLYSIGAPGGNLAVISRRGQVYVLQHLGGKRMSTLNGGPVSSAGVPLKEGDMIQVGDTKLEFHFDNG